jgi:hypothetical protein
MALKTFATSYIRDKAEEAIIVLHLENQQSLKQRQQAAIHSFRKQWFSSLFRKNWTDAQIIMKLLNHRKKCTSIWCTVEHYPTISTNWGVEIGQLLKIKNLADTYEYGDEITITDEEWELLNS